MDGEELTVQETALHDRQIRVWGADAQRRLSKAHVLISGIKATIAEFCKNIVLAGVGSLTLIDDRPVTEEALAANFLIAPTPDVFSGDLSSFDGDFYTKFDVVVISSCSLTAKKLINQKCCKLSKRVAYYTVDCRDSCEEIFVDPQNFTYSKYTPPLHASIAEMSMLRELNQVHHHVPGLKWLLRDDADERKTSHVLSRTDLLIPIFIRHALDYINMRACSFD